MKVAMALAIENRLRDRVHRDIYWRLAAVKSMADTLSLGELSAGFVNPMLSRV